MIQLSLQKPPQPKDSCVNCKAVDLLLLRWEVCQNKHSFKVCMRCMKSHHLLDECKVPGCDGTNQKLMQAKNVARARQKWWNKFNNTLLLTNKIETFETRVLEFSQETLLLFLASVEAYQKLQDREDTYFANYVQLLTPYILGCHSVQVRSDLTRQMCQDDKTQASLQKLKGQLLAHVKSLKNKRNTSLAEPVQPVAAIPSTKSKRGRKPKVEKQQSEVASLAEPTIGQSCAIVTQVSYSLKPLTLNCILCLVNSESFFKWNYCENGHTDNDICGKCLLKLNECPVCRGCLSYSKIRVRQVVEGLAGWQELVCRIESASCLLQSVINRDVSESTKAIVRNRAECPPKTVIDGCYKNLITAFTNQWCLEEDTGKCRVFFEMMIRFSQERENLKNHEFIIGQILGSSKPKTTKTGTCAKGMIKAKKRVVVDDSSIESSLSQDDSDSPRPIPRFIRRQRSRDYFGIPTYFVQEGPHFD